MRNEAQAIVFAAGPGSRMMTLKFQPKALLPVGNYPMIYFPLLLLQNAGFQEVTVIVPSGTEKSFLKVIENCGLKINLDLAPVDTSDDPGTAESLRAIEHKIKKTVNDVVLLSADLITDCDFQPIMNLHRSRGSALTVLLANQNTTFTKAIPPGPKNKGSISNDIFCNEVGTDRLVYAVSGGDYDDNVQLPKRVMSNIKKGIEMCANLLDAHLYIMKRWVVDEIVSKESLCQKMGSLKAEVIPHIIHSQFSNNDNLSNVSLRQSMKLSKYDELICKYNTSNISSRFQHDSDINEKVCHTYHHSDLCVRINTMGSYWQINKDIQNHFDKFHLSKEDNLREPSVTINERAQLSTDSLVGKGTEISEKTNITSCTIGSHCRIKPMVRILNSLVLDYVTVVSGCVIENSLIGCSIEKACHIKNCIITDKDKIQEKAIYENEVLEPSKDYTK